MRKNLSDLFNNKKIILGMIHLAGRDSGEKIQRVLDEIQIYEEEGLDGVIVEDYHGSLEDVEKTLKALSNNPKKIRIGMNTLRNPYLAFELADKYVASFVQYDTIQTSSGDEDNPRRFSEKTYTRFREKYSRIFVFGGVRFKYIPSTGKSLEEDVLDGISKCDAVVTTGEGTGIATPTQKLRDFRNIMEDFPLIVGAGVNERNIKEQLEICDGAIIGSYFKNYDTEGEVNKDRVRKIIDLARR